MRAFLAILWLWLSVSLAAAQAVLGGYNLPGGPPPADSIGQNTQYFLDFTSGNIWGPKAFQTWAGTNNGQFAISHAPFVFNYPPYYAYIWTTQFFVSTTGSDANDCKSPTLSAGSGPCATNVHAAGEAFKTDSNGAPIVINDGPGTFTENIYINGPLRGANNTTPNPQNNGYGPAELLFVGAGSSSTTIAGAASTCGTLTASNFATVGVKALRLTALGNGCQSSLFTQLSGIINVHEDVNFGPATQAMVHSENSGAEIQIWSPYTISGGATSFAAFGGGAQILINAGQGTLNGASANVTISIATPGVVTWANHGLAAGTPIAFSTTGTLPTGINHSQLYYVSPRSLTTNTFLLTSTPFGGSDIATSGSQSGTQSAYLNAFGPFIFGYANGTMQWNIASPWSGTGVGTQFTLLSNAAIESNGNSGVAQIPGTLIGGVSSGGEFHGPANATLLSASAFGSTGTVAVKANSTPRAGTVTITPSGTSIPNNGTVNIGFPYRIEMSDSDYGICMLTPSQVGTGTWASGALFTGRYENNNDTQDFLAVNLSNNGVTFTTAESYVFNYLCTGD